MANEPISDTVESHRDFERAFMWPMIYMPLLWVGLIHLGTRAAWFFGYK